MGHKSKKKGREDESSSSEASASASEASSSESSSSASEAVSKKKDKKSKKSKKEKKEKKNKKSKKEKKSKDGKRGPKGAQWMTWKIPYQENSILGQAFKMAAAKGGVDEKKLGKFIKKNHGTPAFIIRGLKKGYSKGWSWEVDDSHGRIRIHNPKISDKKWKRAA